MASDPHRLIAAQPTSRPGELSPSFAQTGAELTLEDSDIEDLDLRSEVSGLRGAAAASEIFEMRDRNASAGGDTWDEEDEATEMRRIGGGGGGVGHRRGSFASVASFQLYTPDEENAVRRKFDRKLVVFVALLYMLSFLDRSNIGNARIAGMDEDLQTDPYREDWYEWALTAFYISYIAFEWMSLLWRLIPAHIYVSMLVLTWGLTASLQAVATSYPMLIALRLVLGIGEAGFAGIPFYLSFFFRREELAFRTAIFISAAPLATSFASTLAWLIVRGAEYSPVAPWRLLFLIEGFPSVVVSVIAWNVIPDSPQTASYLTKREKKVARLRLRADQPSSSSTNGSSGEKPSGGKVASGLRLREVLSVLRDPAALIPALMFFLTNMAYSSLPVFLPTIITYMGHSSVSAQAMSAPPYLVAFVAVLLTARLSDRLRARTFLIIFHALASAGGYAVLALAESLHLPPWLRYLAVYPAAVGFFNVVTLLITWAINNQSGPSRQGGGFALLQLVGQCGPLVGTRLYPERQGPFYTSGMTACALAMLGVAVLAALLRIYLQVWNRKLDREEHDALQDGTTIEEEGLVGPRRKTTQASFRYML